MNVTHSISQAGSPPITGKAKLPILIVEDELDMCNLFETSLVEAGFSVKVARSSEQALRLLEAREFALVVLDWYLGEGDGAGRGHVTGRAVFEKCRQRYPATPIVAISGVAGVNVREDVLFLDADSFLAKPFSGTLLVRHVRKWLSRSNGSAGEFRFQREDEIVPVDELRKRYVGAVVDFLEGNVSRAAEKLGMHRHTVTSILEG